MVLDPQHEDQKLRADALGNYSFKDSGLAGKPSYEH